ncbi:MAG TPA: hypothetical protein VK466_18530 [Terriglobales bacterium]|nr:hypothetical protein [Terriglobales bacterium]
MNRRAFCVVVALLLIGSGVQAHASATLLLEEPYSYDGTFAGTGHVAVYLDRICADTPLRLRRCDIGELGVVLSRYHGIQGYDWLAIPLVPYLYAVESAEQVPLYADPKLAAFLRDEYRRAHLATIVPDSAKGEIPDGPWVQLVGSAYDRTLYGFEIETSAEKDDELIAILNARSNKGAYRLLSANCADFVRQIINFYYPGALHRNIIGDLGVTTPKQIAKCLARYSKRHPELKSAHFLIPQVPGTVKRSKPVKGVVESAFKAKKYMAPLLVWHPAIVGCFAAAYFTGSRGFDPGKNAMVFDLGRDLEPPMSAQQRRAYLARVESLARGVAEAATIPEARWPRLAASGQPNVDPAGRPLLRVRLGDTPTEVGLARENILNSSEVPELAQHLLLVRLREELRRSSPRASESDVTNDLNLLERLQRARAELRSPLAGTF